MDRFTIVIPAYNQLELLQRALLSALRQEGVATEVIVTDDSTTSAIGDYVSQVSDSRVSYYHHQPGLGAVGNWNFGLQQAQGDYVMLMHHDEAMAGADYLRQVAALLRKGADVVVTQVEVQSGGRRKSRMVSRLLRGFASRHPSSLFFVNAIGPCACLAFRRSCQQPFDSGLHWLVDVEWYYRMLRGRRVVLCNDAVIESQHGHEGQITQQLDVAATFASDRSVVVTKYPRRAALRLMLWLYGHLVLGLKKLLGRI